jgi:hypothetical protein
MTVGPHRPDPALCFDPCTLGSTVTCRGSRICSNRDGCDLQVRDRAWLNGNVKLRLSLQFGPVSFDERL